MARVLGLEIGPHSIRGALVRTTLKKIEVERYVEAPILEAPPEPPPSPPVPADPPREGEPIIAVDAPPETPVVAPRESPVAAAIREVVGALGRTPDRVVTGLHGMDASLRVIELPAGAAKRIAQVLPFELETVLPFAPADAIIDYEVIERTPTELKILAAAARKERIRAFLDPFREAGAYPRELAVGAAVYSGLVPLVPALESADPVLIVHVDETSTDLCVLKKGLPVLTRTLSAGVGAVPRSAGAAQPSDGQWGPGESHSLGRGGAAPSTTREPNQGHLARLEAELRRTLATFRAQSSAPPARAYLSGPLARDAQAVEWLAQLVGAPAEPIPLSEAPGGAVGAERAAFGRAMSLACRVARRDKRLDLLRGEFAPQQGMTGLRQSASLLAGCAALVFVSLVFALVARSILLADEKEFLEAQLERATESAFGEGTTDPREVQEFLESGGRDEDPLPDYDGFDVLDAISRVIPEDIRHDTRRFHFALDDDGYGSHFELQGGVATNSERDRIVELLGQYECGFCEGESPEEKRCFRDIHPGSTTPGPGGQGINYQVEATIRCPNAPEPEDNRRRRNER
jgi:Tfp pilus assembly PilM family ATPase